MNINDKIIEVANRFEGLVEVVSNKVFDDPTTKGKDVRAQDLVDGMHAAGHVDGSPYCAAFVEAVWRKAYAEMNAPQSVRDLVAKNLCPHVMTSFRNVRELGQITAKPERGAIGFMQNGKTDSGHAFIVESVDGDYLNTIEGNTSPSPKDVAADRDGGIGTGGVWKRRRAFSLTLKSQGLWIRGFWNPPKY